MKILAALGTILVGPAALLVAAPPADFTQPQLAPRPAPAWLRLVDLGAANPRLAGYQAPGGVKVEVVAEEPVVVNPVGIAFAPDGTLHVIEWRADPGGEPREHVETFTYKDGTTRKVVTMKKNVKDVVKALKDRDGDGIYDEASVVLEEELPSSMLFHDGWLYVSGRGTVRRYRRSKPDGPYDVREVIAQGFCGYHHHQVSGLTIGPDGWLYISSGDDDNHVEGSDGSRATVLRSGAIFRCRPDGSRVHVFAIGFRNPYRDVAFDAAGHMFHVDNDNEDGSKLTGCRLMHVPEGSDFGWRLRQGARCCVPDTARAAVFGELPGKSAPLLRTGRGAPAGLLIYNDARFPPEYRGLLYYPDVLRRLIRAYRVEPKGAGFEVAGELELLKAKDPLFRPCQMITGPDGAIYVADWRTDSGGAGRLWGDGVHGRIYRLSWAGTGDSPGLALRGMTSWSKLSDLDDEALVKALRDEEASIRFHAQQELARRGPRSRKALLQLIEDIDVPETARLAALGVLQRSWDAELQKACADLVRIADPALRRQAAEAIGLNAAAGDRDAHTALLNVLGDEDLAARRAVAVAMGKVAGPGAGDNLANALAFDDTRDPVLRDGLVRAIESLGKPGLDRLLALAESGVRKDLDLVVEVLAMLRAPAGAEALPRMLKYPHLTIEQRTALIRSYGNYLLDPPMSLEPMVDYLAGSPQEASPVKLAGLQVLALGEGPASARTSAWLVGLLEEEDPALRLAVIGVIGQKRVEKAVPRLLDILGDEDWPAREREAASRALRALNARGAVGALRKVLGGSPRSPEGEALLAEALRTLAALDPRAGGEVAASMLPLGRPGLREVAITVLGADPQGARRVGELFLQGELPREQLRQVSEALRRHAPRDPRLQELYTRVMKSGLRLGSGPEEVARLRAVVEKQGNPQRGRALYLDRKTVGCIGCHPLEGVGRDLPGPDLTRIWETQSLEKVLESLLEPGKEIKEGYQTFRAATRKGQVHTGLRVAQGAGAVILREASGAVVRLSLADIQELGPVPGSLMPDNVLAFLSHDQVIDLVAFLRDRRAQESLRGLALEYLAVGPFSADFNRKEPPESLADPDASYPSPRPGPELRWRGVEAGPTGQLDLKALQGKEPGSLFIQAQVFSPAEQKAAVQVVCDGPARVWVGGDPVPRAAGDVLPVLLRPGWSRILVKVSPVSASLSLRVLGTGIRLARTPEGRE